MKRRIAIVLGLLALLAAGSGAWFLLEPGAGEPRLPEGAHLELAQLEDLAGVPAFALARAGAALTREDLRGRWTFVFFGYTNCPDACPTTLATLTHVQESLRGDKAPVPRVLFVSVDPQRDTPAVLERYAASFGADVIAGAGGAEALRPLLQFFGASFTRNAPDAAGAYTIDHTSNVFLVTPDLRWLATFPPDDDADTVIEDMHALLGVPL